MRRCPYCAEEIQDQAIKCKHCGEWLGENKGSIEVESSKTPQPEPLNNINLVESIRDISENTPSQKTPHIEISPAISPNKIRPWGWGWIILFVFLSSGLRVIKYYNPLIAMLMPLIVMSVALFSYFKIRTRFIKKKLAGMSGFKAGILAYLIGLALFGVFVVIDTFIMNSDFTAINKDFQEVVVAITTKDRALNKDFTLPPKTAYEAKQNIIKIDARRELQKTLHNAFLKYFMDLKNFYGRNPRKNPAKLEAINQAQFIYNQHYEAAKMADEFLKKYYISGSVIAYSEYEKKYEETVQLQENLRKLIEKL